MFLDNALEDRRVALAVPGTFRVDDGNRPALADPQAVGLGAQDAALVDEPERLQPRLEVVPGREAALLLATLRRRLIAAEKDVPARHRHADRPCNPALRIRSRHR